MILSASLSLSYVHPSFFQAEDEVEKLFKRMPSLNVSQPKTNETYFFHLLSKKLEKYDYITSLNFKNINLNVIGMLYIESILDENKSIEKLIFNNCNLSNSNLEDIVSGLEYNETLKSIVFQNNPMISKEAQKKFKKDLFDKNLIIEFKN